MLRIFENVFSDSDIKLLMSLKKESQDQNLEITNESQKRIILEDSSNEYNIVKKCVEKCYNFQLPKKQTIWFVRSHAPINIHTDRMPGETGGSTIMVCLDSHDHGGTIVFKDHMDAADFHNNFITNFYKGKRKNNLSKLYDLSNLWQGEHHIADYLDLDGITNWQAGTMFSFTRTQLHGSTNFTQPKHYILLHTERTL
jgi:hypothetical protein